MFRIIMIVDGIEYTYGTYENSNRANEIAMEIRDARGIDVYVQEI